jgi:hypothetical protein
MNLPRQELGKPDAGKPPVRFDEGREAVAIGSHASAHRFLPTLPEIQRGTASWNIFPIGQPGVTCACGKC